MNRFTLAAILASGLMVSSPASAVEENEALVMKIVFEDCLGYMREDRAPFAGLDTSEPTPDALESLSSHMAGQNVMQLLSPRYVAAWGEDQQVRYCVVHTVWDDEGQVGEPILGVDPDGFIDRVTKRAVSAGLTEADRDMKFSPIHTTYWSEPETGVFDGPLRPITLTIMPTDANADESLLDAGLIIMAGPPIAANGSQ